MLVIMFDGGIVEAKTSSDLTERTEFLIFFLVGEGLRDDALSDDAFSDVDFKGRLEEVSLCIH